MSKSDLRESAVKKFSEWYEFCLENGIEPEEIVSEFGEMILITNPETTEKIKELIENGTL